MIIINKSTVYKYIGKYFANMLRIPYTNHQHKLMFYGNGTLRLKNAINDKQLKRYSNSIAARICLKHILDEYVMTVRPHSYLDSGYLLATKQSTKGVNQHMSDEQLKREDVTVRYGHHTKTLNLPSLPNSHRKNDAEKLAAASQEIERLKAKLHAKNA